MAGKLKALDITGWFVITILQLIMTQVVTLVASFIYPVDETFVSTHSFQFVLLLGICFTAGVVLTGWAAIRVKWLKLSYLWLARLTGTAAGAFIPLLLALMLYHPLEPGNPFFFISMLLSVFGFYAGGWSIDRAFFRIT